MPLVAVVLAVSTYLHAGLATPVYPDSYAVATQEGFDSSDAVILDPFASAGDPNPVASPPRRMVRPGEPSAETPQTGPAAAVATEPANRPSVKPPAERSAAPGAAPASEPPAQTAAAPAPAPAEESASEQATSVPEPEHAARVPEPHTASGAAVQGLPIEPLGAPIAAAPAWVAPHTETLLWQASEADAAEIGPAHRLAALQIIGRAKDGRLPVWDPSDQRYGWVRAADVGPVDPSLVGSAYLPPIGHKIAWSGSARVTMYTCVELGGCAATASGLWPEPGMVAVDPRVIPLGSRVWVEGLGTFLATDTGSLVKGAHIDVFGWSYQDALAWGVQERSILVFAPE